VPTSREEIVHVRVSEFDAVDEVAIARQVRAADEAGADR